MSNETLDLHRVMGQFKLGILLLNLAPYLALRIVT